MQIVTTATGVKLKTRGMISAKLASASDAALAMAYFNGKYSSAETPEGLRVSFSVVTTEIEKAKELRNWTMVNRYDKFEG